MTRSNELKGKVSVSDAKASGMKFIARQPVLDRRQRVYGYELLFRTGLDNFYDGSNPSASLTMIANGVLFHILGNLTEDHKAFVNFTREALIGDYAFFLPKELIIVEILETVESDVEVLAALRHLKDSGYCLALDDVSSCERAQAFLDLVHIVKVDMSLTTSRRREEMVRMLLPRGVSVLAEKVETQEEFREVAAMGFHYFQGYFFAKPEIISGRDIPAFKLNYLRILQAINRPNLDREEIERLIKQEEAFCFKLLRYLNSPFFGFRSTIHSVGHAISLLGEKEIKRWASLLALTAMGDDKPDELLATSLRRASFCESLAAAAGIPDREGDLFLLGLLSLIDAILDRPLPGILSQIPISEDIKAALLHGKTRFATVLHLVEAYEKGDWEKVKSLARTLRMDEAILLEAYYRSIEVAREALRLS